MLKMPQQVTENAVNKAQTVIAKLNDKGKTAVQQSRTKLTATVELTGKLLAQAKQVVSGN